MWKQCDRKSIWRKINSDSETEIEITGSCPYNTLFNYGTMEELPSH